MSKDYNDMRSLLGKMRKLNNPNKVQEYTAMGKKNTGVKKEMNMRDMLKITRKKTLNEAAIKEPVTSIDKKEEEEKLRNYFNNEVNINFDELVLYNNAVWFGGVINNVLKWVFTVGVDENLNNIEIELLENPTEKTDDVNNVSSVDSIDTIAEKLKAYYNNEFKPYWIQNHLQK